MATRTLMTVLFAAGLVLLAGHAYAKDNLCGECHTQAEMASFGGVMRWDRSVFQDRNTICPGMLELKKDMYFTESRLAKYDVQLDTLETNTRRYPEYMREDLAKSAVAYADLLSSPVPTSIDAFGGPDLKIKKGLHANVYDKVNKLSDDYTMEKVVGLGLMGVMLVMLLLFFGLKNTVKE